MNPQISPIDAERGTTKTPRHQGLSLAKRKALLAEVAKTATGKALAGLRLIDLRRRPTARERAYAETLVEKARCFFSRGKV